jgi:hypothetical protein
MLYHHYFLITNILDIITKYFNDRKISSPFQYSLADLAKPRAVEMLQARIARYEAMSDEELLVRAAAWERFKQNIDADRTESSKLYSRFITDAMV